jgi:TRAP-type C4-dicarboxylate transport system permease small subunit
MRYDSGLLARVVGALAMALACLGAMSLMVVAVLTVANAILRRFLSSPILGAEEIASLLTVLAVVSFLPVSFIDEHHLEIDLVMRGFGHRAYRRVGIGAALAVAFFLAAMTWQLVLFAVGARQSGDATWFLALKTWPWWMAVCLMLAVALLAQVMVISRRIGCAKNGDGD